MCMCDTDRETGWPVYRLAVLIYQWYNRKKSKIEIKKENTQKQYCCYIHSRMIFACSASPIVVHYVNAASLMFINSLLLLFLLLLYIICFFVLSI